MPRAITAGLRKLIAAPDLAIDLGTANTRLYALGHGLIADEPSLIRLQPETGEVEAVGAHAAWLANVDPYSPSVSPLHAGVVADVEAASSLLKPFLKRAHRFGLFKPRVLACAPTDACEEERAALIEAAQRAGASDVYIAPEPIAAAIGAGLDISSHYAQMLVDIGDGVTDIAVIRAGNLILTSAVRTACSDLRNAVSEMVSYRHGVLLFPQEAERLMHLIGANFDYSQEELLVAAGTDWLTGEPLQLCVSSYDLNEAIEPVLDTIVDAIQTTVRKLPEETSCEVIENGICLTGGGAMLQGLPERLAAATSFEVRVAEDPLMAVINGARQMLDVGIATDVWQN
ncbi:MAG TPA: rod shape-determining protein [Blastocatellia bacterium]|nr:rod shape-determining protein [Blastocatellia bacterium]HMV82524.1 rod shape-determining protein [Blastocatellia bacterium]HMX24662.1 rod shape-determining protein [Blastocatellia bacterium]HMZ18906.1 rod shape-determining protein [Blastocatellia bacterium]HNG30103.1 rod shape-determining protein [Blastocatellia bacterium]